jgi:hypothetical protein
MKNLPMRLLLPLALTAALVACGDEPPPPKSTAFEPIPEAAPPRQPPRPRPPPPPAAPVAVETTTTMPSDAIGGTPVLNTRDARARGSAALDKYLADRQIPRKAYSIKQTVRNGEDYELTAFGAYNGEAHYLTIKVFKEGHVDVVSR